MAEDRRSRILIVDDDEMIRELVRVTLGDEFEVREASSAEEALRTARSWQPDLVLLDVMMPGRDGFDVCRDIRSDADLSATLVVMLTARGSVADIAEGASAGADGYFTKPFSPSALLERVDELLEVDL